ncbi:putative F-box and leucine-rich repeat protein GRR1 [Rosellinia necatrix]|uniref:Putative F-box and leucine-rich repeat protein GRR1 n=1 Tax=Rosellinia necatrix TaxID=77044 RepID=A0A1W2TVU6_ROSNE|nr:putative F-box and leucine-rich repeat protein GRR1 [Rosellinia necatrix]
MTRPPAPALDVIAARASAGAAATGSAAATTVASGANRLPVPVAAEDSRDSRSSSSTNSPAPPDNEESDFFLANNDSQSSLGVVPNLQDMQVTDPECLPTVAALPSEILISIFSRISDPKELLNCMLTCKRWARNVVEILWHRPSCTTWDKHSSICSTLALEQPFFTYTDFIKRLNLAALADHVSDGSVTPLAVCTRVERLTLTNCHNLTDLGLTALVQSSQHLLALDISGDNNITEASVNVIAANCRKLQGLNVSGCRLISNESLIRLAEKCRYIKRLKLNDCGQLNDAAVLAFAGHCPNILEIDLHQCVNIGNEPVSALLIKEHSLRELRLASCELVDDGAFLALPSYRTYENLRILDLTSCSRLTDRAVEKIIDVAPRLRNLVLAKCSNITDVAVHAIAKLQKNLHYVHLGHCRHITDDAVKRLVRSCNRIRYIDLGCCTNLTDESVTLLAALPKLKRIGLVKCASITDKSMYALATANDHRSQYRNAAAHPGHESRASSLERVHLSYCTNLTLPSIIKLLNCCQKLTHLSLTGVPAFLRDDLDRFCREAPPDFTEHQRAVFCVFSGTGVGGLRDHLNTREEFAEYRVGRTQRRRPGVAVGTQAGPILAPDMDGFEEGDGLDDDDMGDGSDVIDFNADLTNLAHNPIPPPLIQHNGGIPLQTQVAGLGQAGGVPGMPNPHPPIGANLNEVNPNGQATVTTGPSTAGTGLFDDPVPSGPSTASMQAHINGEEAQTP